VREWWLATAVITPVGLAPVDGTGNVLQDSRTVAPGATLGLRLWGVGTAQADPNYTVNYFKIVITWIPA